MQSVAEKLHGLDRFRWLFVWLNWFYPAVKDVHYSYLAMHFLPQKLMRINGSVPWPVHFTSRVIDYSNIRIGRNCTPGFSHGCYIQGKNGILFGDNVYIGPNVGIISANHSLSNYNEWISAPPIRIGSNVWIGMGAIVLPGVNIGDNSVIGAGSVVTKNIPPRSIAAGNPCRVIKANIEGHEGVE